MTPHLIHDTAYRVPTAHPGDGQYQMVVEIPAGTLDKWTLDSQTGTLHHEMRNGKPRTWNFLPYPMNYGFIPQTFCPPETGGDGDAIDVCLLSAARPRGEIATVRIIGGLQITQEGKPDDKLIALIEGGPFGAIHSLEALMAENPKVLEVLKLWYEGYKGNDEMAFCGYIPREEALERIETAHGHWLSAQGITP